jgi:hypothetical protein
MESKSILVRSMDRLKTLFGVGSTTSNKNTNNLIEKLKKPGTFSSTEINLLRSSAGNNVMPSVAGLKQDMLSVSTQVSQKIDHNKSFQSMVPEIGKARTILIPSILSPSDMYGETLTISLNTDKLDENTKSSISDLLSEYFNEKIKLGSKLSKWIGDALFDTGATPIMILPKKAIKILIEDIENSSKINKPPVQENIDNDANFKKVSSVEAHVSVESFDSMYSSTDDDTFNIKLSDVETIQNEISNEDLEESIISSFGIDDAQDIKNIKNKIKDKKNILINSAFEMMKDEINISIDSRKIASVEKTKQTANSKYADKLNGLLDTKGGEKIYTISDIGLPEEDDEPFIQKLPCNSVIPVFIPGSPESHVGYFIVIDELGNPIDENFQHADERHTIGTPFLTTMDDIVAKDLGSSSKRFNSLSMVFDLTLKNTLKSSINSLGINNIALPDDSKLYSCIFNRALHKQKVTLLYVPTSHMCYYAYDYRENGTGKGLMEDSSFLIRMRTSFLIAQVISALNNSTDRHKISFGLGDNKGTNVEQIMDMLKDAFITKYMYNMDHNPMNVMRDLVSRSVSIVPKEIQGITDLEVSTEQAQGQAGNNRDDLEDILTNLIISNTKVPAGALNETSENEYSRSVATTNIIFSNFLRTLQAITCDITESLVKSYSRNSYHLLSEIINLIKENEDGIDSHEKMRSIVSHVLASIKVSLPSPNISPDKARFTELDTIVETIEKLAEKLLPEELIMSEDENSKTTLIAIRAQIVSELIKNSVTQLGASGIVDVSKFNIENLDTIKVQDINQMIKNYTNALVSQQKSTTPKNEEVDSDEGSDDASWG